MKELLEKELLQNVSMEESEYYLGFIYHHACDDASVPLFNETRIEHTNVMTKEQ